MKLYFSDRVTLNKHGSSSQGENLILSLLLNYSVKTGLAYVKHVGYREFYPDGKSFGICSSEDWKKQKKSEGFNELIGNFYTNELLTARRNNRTVSIRVQGQSYNTFLKVIGSYGLGNVMVIYRFYQDKIQGFYFLAHMDDFNAVNAFTNDLKCFDNITKQLEPKINQIVERYSMRKASTDLIPEHALTELFPANYKSYKTKILSNGLHRFTEKQEEILLLLSTGCTKYKEIADRMNIHPKTAEWHLRQLKQKVQIYGKKELELLAKSLNGQL